jgi:hypothetical protein
MSEDFFLFLYSGETVLDGSIRALWNPIKIQ